MAVIKTLKGQTVVTVVCNIIYPDPPPLPPPDPDTLIQHIHKMASAWRVVAFFLIVFAVPVVLIALPLYARYTLYPARSLALVAADTADLHQLASSFWCQGQRMSSNGTFDAYLLPKAPKLNKKRRRTTTVSRVLSISEEQPEVRMVHLLKGSRFSLGVCSRWPGGTVIVVQGLENFNRCYYTEDRDWDDIVELSRARNAGPHPHPHPPTTVSNSSSSSSSSSDTGRTTSTTTSRPRVKSILPIGNDDVVGDAAESDAREVFDDTDDDAYTPVDNLQTWTIAADAGDVETTTIRLLNKEEVTAPAGASSTTESSTTEKVRYRTKTTKTTALKSTTLMARNIKTTELPQKDKLTSTTQKSGRPTSSENIVEESGKSSRPSSINLQDELKKNNVLNEIKAENDSSRVLRVLRSILTRPDPADGSDEKRRQEAETAKKLGMLHSINDTRDVTAGNSSMSSSEEFMEMCKSTILMEEVSALVDCQAQDVSKGPKWSFPIDQTDDYYFIFMSDNSLEENVMNFYLKLDRVMYNVSSNLEVCGNSTECSFPLSFMGTQAVVVEMAEPTYDEDSNEVLYDLSSYEMQTVCQPRVAVYMVFILMVPFIILLFAFQ